ncbi:hypothetical protein OUZ56_005119 [Daphnia magna]|uniref:Uncharacterized protein n=1 Tax=Daphnia magna TaxID=35525 RepID=A0ABQ9YRW1_9CRUS|nr:hypothetical protein OUZ56_005119 [Daphnia magna]
MAFCVYALSPSGVQFCRPTERTQLFATRRGVAALPVLHSHWLEAHNLGLLSFLEETNRTPAGSSDSVNGLGIWNSIGRIYLLAQVEQQQIGGRYCFADIHKQRTKKKWPEVNGRGDRDSDKE